MIPLIQSCLAISERFRDELENERTSVKYFKNQRRVVDGYSHMSRVICDGVSTRQSSGFAEGLVGMYASLSRKQNVLISLIESPLLGTYHTLLQSSSLAEQHLWIDALCIDQNDISERSSQVKDMLAIYSMVSEVLAWLGEPKEHKELLGSGVELGDCHGSASLELLSADTNNCGILVKRLWDLKICVEFGIKRPKSAFLFAAGVGLELHSGVFRLEFPPAGISVCKRTLRSLDLGADFGSCGLNHRLCNAGRLPGVNWRESCNIPFIEPFELNVRSRRLEKTIETCSTQILEQGSWWTQSADVDCLSPKLLQWAAPSREIEIHGIVSQHTEIEAAWMAISKVADIDPFVSHPPLHISSSAALIIKLPYGSHKAVKLFYDTGSTDNMITESFVNGKAETNLFLEAGFPVNLKSKCFPIQGSFGTGILRHYVKRMKRVVRRLLDLPIRLKIPLSMVFLPVVTANPVQHDSMLNKGYAAPNKADTESSFDLFIVSSLTVLSLSSIPFLTDSL